MYPSFDLLLHHPQEIVHFLSVRSCDTLPLTRLEGLKELSRQLGQNKAEIRELLKECHGKDLSLSWSSLEKAVWWHRRRNIKTRHHEHILTLTLVTLKYISV